MFETILSRFGFEKRSYSDAIVQAILSTAEGNPVSSAATSAVEASAGITGRAFASAKVNGKRQNILTPSVRMGIGRDLIRRGESLWVLEPDGEAIQLFPVAGYTVSGGYNPKSWIYDVDLCGPSKTLTRKGIAFDDVIHIRINVDSYRPWQGVPATAVATLSSELAAQTTKHLADEAKGPRGSVLAIPGGDSGGLADDIKNAKGAALVLESVQGGYQSSTTMSARGEYEQKRFGLNVPAAVVELLRTSNDLTLAAIGISGALFSAKDAASAVSAYRSFAHSVIGPLGNLAQAELADKLDDTELSLDFADLRAADVAQRAASLKRMVEAGIETEKALALSGLLADESA